jgi:hypothetical protein
VHGVNQHTAMLHRVASSEALRGVSAHQSGLWRGLAPSNGLSPYRTAAATLSRYVAETCQSSAPGLSQLSAGLQRGSAQVGTRTPQHPSHEQLQRGACVSLPHMGFQAPAQTSIRRLRVINHPFI